MKLGEILKCARAGVSTDDVKAIQALDNVSVDDAIDLIKAGYKADDLKELVTDEETAPKDEESTPKDEETPPEDEEKKRLQTELDKAKKDLEQAQLNNTKKDVGTGEKPNPERELEKLFAEL